MTRCSYCGQRKTDVKPRGFLGIHTCSKYDCQRYALNAGYRAMNESLDRLEKELLEP